MVKLCQLPLNRDRFYQLTYPVDFQMEVRPLKVQITKWRGDQRTELFEGDSGCQQRSELLHFFLNYIYAKDLMQYKI